MKSPFEKYLLPKCDVIRDGTLSNPYSKVGSLYPGDDSWLGAKFKKRVQSVICYGRFSICPFFYHRNPYLKRKIHTQSKLWSEISKRKSNKICVVRASKTRSAHQQTL